MTGYEQFQQIMAEIERKKRIAEGKLPPELERIFNVFTK